ncbi:unnamed protein product [Blepharisma stoltei]|uniref:Autophagy-related protein 101 n=1 Tax=Blepharisma stoltei TaxID=1481888 RepID=A0AAU9JZM8_9CILI|nr:unnamed protein product [Blepharisma stoltei]
MNHEQNVIKGLVLEPRQVKDALRVIIHSILFQRELGVVTPRQVESDCGVFYLTLNDINTDKHIEEQLTLFENRLQERPMLILTLSFYQTVKKKTFLFIQEKTKVIWEEWKIPIQLQQMAIPEPRKSDSRLAKKLRKRLMAIIERICEKKDHLPSIGEADDPTVIRFPYEISSIEAEQMPGNYFGKNIPHLVII